MTIENFVNKNKESIVVFYTKLKQIVIVISYEEVDKIAILCFVEILSLDLENSPIAWRYVEVENVKTIDNKNIGKKDLISRPV